MREKADVCGRELVFIILISLFVGACGAPPPPPKSRFLSSFSAKDAIQKSYHAGQSVAVRTDGVETATFGGTRHIYHRNDLADVNIDQSDESGFLERLKSEIERELQETGGKITDGGSGDGHYSFGYSDGKIVGWLDLWGVRTSADSYRVTITISEY